MKHISMSNLLCNWDISLLKVIEHLKEGRPDSALIRCKEMHKFVTNLKEHCKDCDLRIVDDL
jgi:hypothetical protein